MRKHTDLTGRIFGRWIVLHSMSSQISTRGRENRIDYGYLCRCACGKEKKVWSGNLTSGKSFSCGCARDEKRWKGSGISARNRLLRSYKNNAKSRELTWNLTDSRFFFLTKQDCHYCGSPPRSVQSAWGSSGRVGSYIYNGVDRKDNSQSYFLDNCVPCCFICQRAKMDLPYGEFMKYLSRVKVFQGTVANG
jgi:hypothetical protein